MKLTGTDIKGSFENSMLLEYLEKVVGNRPLKDVVLKLSYRLQIFTEDGDSKIIEAIDKDKVDYIILATKLSTMVEVFNMMKEDNNLVMVDKLEQEITRFEEKILSKIEIGNKELTQK